MIIILSNHLQRNSPVIIQLIMLLIYQFMLCVNKHYLLPNSYISSLSHQYRGEAT